jgi:beta-lactamase regulating signal transducer with metallopeptidase domain
MPLVHIADAIRAELAGCVIANSLGANSASANLASLKSVSATFAAFAHSAAPAAVAALWQGALVALALVLCLRFVLRVSAAHRFALWAAGFVIAAGLPLLPLLEHSSAVAAAPLGSIAARPWLVLDSRWGFAIAALWLAASAFRAAELAFNLLRLRGLWRDAAPVKTEMNLRSLLVAALPARSIEICTTRDLDRPSVIGFFVPRILIPEWLYSRLTPSELEQVVLHETEHLRRRDDWMNLLQKLSLVVFPLNPALAWMERRLCREREMACDEGVVRRTQSPRTYAECLTTLAERGLQQREYLRRAQALSLGALERRPELVHRVQSILRRRRALHPLAAGALVGVMACGLGLGAIELSRSPQLVAFVAAPKPDAQIAALELPNGNAGIARASYTRTSQPSPVATDAVSHPSERFNAPFRAIDTKAIVPASRNAAADNRLLGGSDSSPEITETATTGVGSAPRAVPVNATSPILAETADRNQESQTQEFVVLTAWEEVETSSPRTSPSTTRTIADYDTGADTQQQPAGAASQSDVTPAAQITFTRLILIVYPASIYPASAYPPNPVTPAQPTPKTSSTSHRPASSYSGWLFFQL